MNRNDWVFVGVRLIGVFLVASALADLPSYLESVFAGRGTGWRLFTVPVQVWVGCELLLRGPRICSWLEKRDQRGNEAA